MVNKIDFKKRAMKLSLFEEQLIRCLYESEQPASVNRLAVLMPALFGKTPDECAIRKGLSSLCARGLICAGSGADTFLPALPEEDFARLLKPEKRPGLTSLWIE